MDTVELGVYEDGALSGFSTFQEEKQHFTKKTWFNYFGFVDDFVPLVLVTFENRDKLSCERRASYRGWICIFI